MKLVISIDVEEDNWGDYQPERVTVENIKKIPALQSLFDEFQIKPTYLIAYPVATDPFSIELFTRYLADDKCEIGMHCHPWNTPPIKEEICEHNTMLCNLPEKLVHQKLSFLHETICANFGIAPVSFRAGRWAFGPTVARSLCRLGYRVDSSVSAYIDWGRYHGPDFSKLGPESFSYSTIDIKTKEETYTLLQVPATVGFLQPNFDFCQRVVSVLEKPFARKLHIGGILRRLRLLNKVWLSPELSGAGAMIKLARRMKNDNYSYINLSFHSTSLQAGLSPFVKSRDDERNFMQKIRNFLAFIQETDIECCTLADIEKHHCALETKMQSVPQTEYGLESRNRVTS
jgi:hypothetical protein